MHRARVALVVRELADDEVSRFLTADLPGEASVEDDQLPGADGAGPATSLL